jgi:hypothetical protein
LSCDAQIASIYDETHFTQSAEAHSNREIVDPVVPANQVQRRQGLSVKRLSQTRMKPSMALLKGIHAFQRFAKAF